MLSRKLYLYYSYYLVFIASLGLSGNNNNNKSNRKTKNMVSQPPTITENNPLTTLHRQQLTEQDRQMSLVRYLSELLSYPLTLAWAIQQASILPTTTASQVMVIHVIGASSCECNHHHVWREFQSYFAKNGYKWLCL